MAAVPGRDAPELAGINHKAAAAQKPNQRQAKLPRELYCQAGWRRYGSKHRNPRRQRLLGYLETAPATHQQYVPRERKMPLKQRPSHDLVDCVVPADILAEHNHFSVSVKESCGMQASCTAEDCLVRAEQLRQPAHYLRIDSEIGVWLSQPAPANRID